MILREYLYLDTPLVRGILAQLGRGVDETETSKETKQKRTTGGLKGVIGHDQAWGDDVATQRSLADAVFPTLEGLLESEGILEDVSDVASDPATWENGAARQAFPAGKVIRITAPGWLMDSRFMASVMANFATLHHGMAAMGHAPAATATPPIPPKAKGAAAASKAYKPLPREDEMPEGDIPLGMMRFSAADSEPLSGESMRGTAQVIRAMFAPGLHLSLIPEATGAGSITARLQEGRDYMDVDPDVVFARYGAGAQEWTLVGAVGHHATATADLSQTDAWSRAGNIIDRSAFARHVTGLAANLASYGLADLAQEPGFSMVPWAVYRTLGHP